MKQFIQEIVTLLHPHVSLSPEELERMLERPPDPAMGDYGFPCFALAKSWRKAPAQIAAELAQKIRPTMLIPAIRPLGPYINFFLNKQELISSVLRAALQQGDAYGQSSEGNGQTVIVEFSSPNIAKPFGVGHLRSTVIGNALYHIYQALGYHTIRINHLGDWGTQFGKLIVAYKAWGQDQVLQANPIQVLYELYVRFHTEAEQNPALEDEARIWFKKLEEGDTEARRIWQWFKELSLKEFQRIYDRLGISFDYAPGESFYNEMMADSIARIQAAGLAQYSEGALIVDLTPYHMPPLLLRKRDEATLYATRDLAAAEYRYRTFHFAKMLYVVGADQKLHFQQFFKVLELMGYPWAQQCVHIDFGLVKFQDEKMGTRKGNIIFLEDVLDKAVALAERIIAEKNPGLERKREVAEQIGIGAVIFADLSSRRSKDIHFQWERVLNFDGETAPYIQYTHARACSVLRKYGREVPPKADYTLLALEAEFALCKLLGSFAQIVHQAAETYEPSVLSSYLIELAECFNAYYHQNRILTDDPALQEARVLLTGAVRQVLYNGLKLLGIQAPAEM
jgi:arginyl-tRNA synthetase